MPRYFLKMAFRGTAYHGWQQQENAHTVQAEMNEKIGTLCGERVNVVGCGRTDTGVHAREFYLHFDLSKPLPFSENDFVYKINRFLPGDIVVFGAWEVPPEAHARFDAVSRTYRYYIALQKDPFLEGLVMPFYGRLNVQAMQEAAGYLLEYTDFTSFSKLHTQTVTNICHVSQAGWEQKENLLIFTISADRFLRNMVRAIVGTLLETGRGRMEPAGIKQIIEAHNRSSAGFSVPAEGLFLEKIRYPDNLETLFKQI